MASFDDSDQLLLEMDISPLSQDAFLRQHLSLTELNLKAPDLDAPVLEAAIANWEERTRSEYLGVLIFRHLHDLLIDLNAPLDIQQLAVVLMNHENRHSLMCAEAAQSLGGGADGYGFEVDELKFERSKSPLSLQLVNQVVTVLCCGEVVAYQLLRHTLKAVPDSPYRALLQQILRDEVLHARIGFQLLTEIKNSDWCEYPGDLHVKNTIRQYSKGLLTRDVVDSSEAKLFEKDEWAEQLAQVAIPKSDAFKKVYLEAIPHSFTEQFSAIGISL